MSNSIKLRGLLVLFCLVLSVLALGADADERQFAELVEKRL